MALMLFWHRQSIRSWLAVCLLIVSSVLIVAGSFSSARAETSSTGWLNGIPQINKVGDLSVADAKSNDSSCANMTLPVVRSGYQTVFTNNEQHCMVRTSEGLVGQDLSVILLSGFSKAYPVHLQMAGYPALVPIPNYPGALLYTADPAYPGNNIGLYKDVLNHLTFNGSLLAPAFNMSGPDLYFRYPNGRGMAFNALKTQSFSSGGENMVVDGVFQGFVRINMTSLKMTTFAQDLPRTSGDGLFEASTASSPSGKYAAIGYDYPEGWGDKYFKVVDVDSCGDATAAFDATKTTCKTVDFLPQLQKAIPGLVNTTHITFASDSSINFVATIQNGTTKSYARYEMTASGQAARLKQYLALGDSFASGEGTFDYIAGTDNGENKCHQSLHSYPYLVGVPLGSTASVACSGAVMSNIFRAPYQKINQEKGIDDSQITIAQRQEAINSHTPGVILQSNFVDQDNPQAVTISIGGNDVGFADIIKRCITPYDGGDGSQDCYGTYSERHTLVDAINAQFDNLAQTYQQLKMGDQTRRVYVVGYPQLVNPNGDCAVNVHLSRTETVFASQLVSYLNAVVAKAAAQAGVQYVDTEHALDGHRLCEPGDKAVNGLTAGHDIGGVIGDESYHPNQLGHELMATAIQSATHGLTTPMLAVQSITAPQTTDSLDILQVPRVDSTIYTLMNMTNNILQLSPGSAAISIDQFYRFVQPNSTFRAVLHSTPMNVGTVSANANGVISGSLQIPGVVPAGFHTLHLYGKNIVGDLIDIQETVYVQASATDYDGDGVPNEADSCAYIPQSGQDVDQDGIDDACDPVIGSAPAQPPTSLPITEPNPNTTETMVEPLASTVVTATMTAPVGNSPSAVVVQASRGIQQAQTTGFVLSDSTQAESTPSGDDVAPSVLRNVPNAIHQQAVTVSPESSRSYKRIGVYAELLAGLLIVLVPLVLWRRSGRP